MGDSRTCAYLELEVFGVPNTKLKLIESSGGGTVFSATIGKVTLGEILQGLVQVVDSSLDLVLPPPWDSLTEISLSGLEFQFSSVSGVGVKSPPHLGIKLPFITIDQVSVWCLRGEGGNHQVNLEMDCTILGQKPVPPFKWDVCNDSQKPPVPVPNASGSVFELDYLGLGQRIALAKPADTLGAIITELESANKSSISGEPPPKSVFQFAPDAGWLFGIKFAALNTVAMSVVFNDPQMYGLLITLSGERAGKLAGLSFEILYRKISDNLGVFHAELTLPDVLRKFDLGEVSVTLCVIDVDIYTDGGFLVDLGFPHNRDFSDSFALEMFPFEGAGGLYFGDLSAKAAPDVPVATNGTFSPVVEFGLGLQVGVGKSVSYGIVTGGFEVGVEGILQGVFASFNPQNKSDTTAVFYKVSGEVALVGHLYGGVDFGLIKASLDIMVYASATVTLESYRPTTIGISAGVSVDLTVKIVFFSVHFHFSATISESVVVGAVTPTPWTLAPSEKTAIALLASGSTRTIRSAPLQWRAVKVVDSLNPIPIDLYFVPQVTVGLSEDLLDPSSASNTGQQVLLVAQLFVETRSFAQMSGALFQWAVQTALAGTGSSSVTREVLESILDDLSSHRSKSSDAADDPTGFTSAAILSHLLKNFSFDQVPKLPESGDGLDVTVFPMLPGLRMNVTAQGNSWTRSFDEFRCCDAEYRKQITKHYFKNKGGDGNGGLDGLVDPEDEAAKQQPAESMVEVLMVDYWRLALRQIVQAALPMVAAGGIPYDTLLEQLEKSEPDAFAEPAGSVARFMLHGLRLPDPGPCDKTPPTAGAAVAPAGNMFQGPLFPLYSLTGQQWAPGPVNLTRDYAVKLGVTAKSGTSIWWEPPDLTQQEDVFGALLDGPRSFQPAVEQCLPSSGCRGSVRSFALGRPTMWQQPDGVSYIYPFPNPLRRQIAATLAPGDDGALAPPALDLQVWAGLGASGAPTNLGDDAVPWTRLEFEIRRLPGKLAPRQSTVSVVEVYGTGGSGGEDLAQLLTYLEDQNPVIELLYAPAPQNGSSDRLQSDAFGSGAPVLIKTNLSTSSHPPPALAAVRQAVPPPVSVGATLQDGSAFLKLLWECSVVNSGGYFLYYCTKDGKGLPTSLFAQGRTALLTVMVKVDSQEVLSFHNCYNVVPDPHVPSDHVLRVAPIPVTIPGSGSPQTLSSVAVGQSVDPTSLGEANVAVPDLLDPQGPLPLGESKAAQDYWKSMGKIVPADFSHQVTPGETLLDIARSVELPVGILIGIIQKVSLRVGATLNVYADWVDVRASIPAGSVGFRLVRTPPAKPETNASDYLANLYNLLAVRVQESDAFAAGPEGLPRGPTIPNADPAGTPPPDSSNWWIYQGVVHISGLAKNGAAAGPDESRQDPYAGVGQEVVLGFGYRDLYGNRLSPPGQPGKEEPPALPVPVRYSDQIIALGRWKHAAMRYRFQSGSAGTEVSLRLTYEPDHRIPGPDDIAADAPGRAKNDRELYQRIHQQISRPDVGFALTTSLNQEQSYPLDNGVFVAFVARVRDYLAVRRPLVVHTGDTLQAITDRFNRPRQPDGAPVTRVTVEQLAQANRDNAALLAVGTTLQIPGPPRPYEIVQGDTLGAIAQSHKVDLDQLARFNATQPVLAANPRANVPFRLESPSPGHGAAGGALLAVGSHDITLGELLAKTPEFAKDAERGQDLVAANLLVGDILGQGTVTYRVHDQSIDIEVQGLDTIATVATSLVSSVPNKTDSSPPTPDVLIADPNFFNQLPLRKGSYLLVPPAPCELSVAIETDLADLIVPVTVQFVIERAAAFVEPALLQSPGVQRASTTVKPEVAGPAEGSSGLTKFAEAFENACPGLKLATGATPAAAGGSGTRGQLLAVQFQNGNLDYSIGTTPRFFAPAPLATKPWSGKATVKAYTSGTGLGADGAEQKFHDVDVDTWLRDFLATFDAVLGQESAMATFLLGIPTEYVFPSLMEYKETLASLIAGTVTDIFESSDPTGDMGLQNAQETLKQELRTELSAAYKVDAIVQYEADTSVIGEKGELVGRLAGKPVTRDYAIPPGATLASIAAEFAVDPFVLIDVIGNQRGILREPHGPANTLAKVVAKLAAGPNGTAALGGLITLLDLLRQGAKLPIVVREFTASQGDTVRSAFAYLVPQIRLPEPDVSGAADLDYERAVLRFATENLTVTDVFLPDTSLDLYSATGNFHYRTRANDTFLDIARGLGGSPHPKEGHGRLAGYTVSDDDVDQAAWVVRLLIEQPFGAELRVGVTFGYMTVEPAVTLSDAKVALVAPSSDATPTLATLTFLLSTANPDDARRFSHLRLPLGYQVNFLEYDIGSDGEAAPGYQQSKWLTFVIPPRVASLGVGDVPLPLRTHPTTPTLIDEQIYQVLPPQPQLADLKRFRYRLTYSAQRAAQDELCIQVGSNVSVAATRPLVEADSLVAALAQYAHVAGALRQDLALLPEIKLPPAADDPQAKIAAMALVTFANIAESVVTALQSSQPSPQTVTHVSRMRRGEEVATGLSNGSQPTRILYVRQEGTCWTPTAGGEAITAWYGPSRRLNGVVRAASMDGPEPTRRATPQYGVELGDFDVTIDQNVSGSITVIGNNRLVAGRPTNEAFIYQSHEVATGHPPLVPSFVPDQIVDVASLRLLSTAEAATLTNRLETLFARLLDLSPGEVASPSVILQVTVSLSQCLARSTATPGNGASQPSATLAVVTPVYFWLPQQVSSIDGATDPGSTSVKMLAQEVADALNAWLAKNQPVERGASWVLSVGLFTTLAAPPSTDAAAAAAAPSPAKLLWLKDLQLALEDVGSDW